MLQKCRGIESIKCGLLINTMFPPLQWDKLHLKEKASCSKDMCNLRWNVTLCNMKTKLKQLEDSTC